MVEQTINEFKHASTDDRVKVILDGMKVEVRY